MSSSRIQLFKEDIDTKSLSIDFFDSFKNFEERGSYFNKLIKKYINERKII